ncbi:YtpR family tRNA-binding protein [Paraliobacillus sp. JSM ZJ581]|uniref:YtpR family tRNA-binding protein n=1 Tax=Paraliobacillus sp. JSM ZJ581 TaxID=3342118 RepID=UPI0035A87EE9
MQVFYNKQGIGDCLIIMLKQGDRYELEQERFGNVVKITDRNTKEVLGYNIFDVSNDMEIQTNKLEVTETLIQQMHAIFEKNGLTDVLDVDLSPKFVVGYVEEKKQHENADKLSVCQVNIGQETVQIVCGAPNVEKGQHVVVAKVGAVMPSGMEIKEANLRGVDSFGMICSQKELRLPNAPEEKGIYVLTNDVNPGDPFISN